MPNQALHTIRGNMPHRDQLLWRIKPFEIDPTGRLLRDDNITPALINVINWRVRSWHISYSMHCSGTIRPIHGGTVHSWSIDSDIEGIWVPKYEPVGGFGSYLVADEEQHLKGRFGPPGRHFVFDGPPKYIRPFAFNLYILSTTSLTIGITFPASTDGPDIDSIGGRFIWWKDDESKLIWPGLSQDDIDQPSGYNGVVSAPVQWADQHTAGPFDGVTITATVRTTDGHTYPLPITGTAIFSVLDQTFSYPYNGFFQLSGSVDEFNISSADANVTMEPELYYKYRNSLGEDVYDEFTGEQINDPLG